jgi:hypothetical protein
MSQGINTELFERAARQIDVWVGTPIAATLEFNLAQNDLTALLLNVRRAELMEYEDEQMSDPDNMTPERAEALYAEAEFARDAKREEGEYPDVA